ncbi:acyl--CoA ligase, partial [candidate division KSB1 bacterium]|nr:acyl--CoA ligase [candidate division KSB1 bacterium]
MQPFLIQHFLEYSARTLPDKSAVIHNTNSITYSQLNYQANQLSHFFLEQGIQKGDRIAIILENSIEFIVAYYAIAKVGAVSVPLNIELPDEYLLDILSNCQISAIICTSHRTKFSKKILKTIPTCKFVVAQSEKFENWRFSLTDIFATVSPEYTPPQLIDLDLAAIIYTSGSTSQPRGVMLNHLNLVQNSRAIVTYLNLTATASILVVLPFFYIYGLSLLNTHILVGGTLILENQIVFPNVIIQTLKNSKAHGFAGVPATYALLLNRSTFRQEKFPDLHYLTQAGGPMAPALIEELIRLLPDKRIFIMYGATEASARLAYLDPQFLPAKIGSVGRAIPNVELKIVNEQGEVCKTGEIGEIVARGSNIMQGYW